VRPRWLTRCAQEFYNNDLANSLKTNHLDITFQPTYVRHPYVSLIVGEGNIDSIPATWVGAQAGGRKRRGGDLAAARDKRGVAWSAELTLEKLLGDGPPRQEQDVRALQAFLESMSRPTIELAVPPAAVPPAQAEAPNKAVKPRRTRPVEGSLLRVDGSTEASNLTVLGGPAV
jgi:hypothetical protein